MRQIRVKQDKCDVDKIGTGCLKNLNSMNEDKGIYGLNWEISSENSTNKQFEFSYQKDDTLIYPPYVGYYSYYPSNGFLYEFKGTQDQVISNLTILENFNWIDSRTRAIFLQFSIFNPNINIFMYCTILFEFLPNGIILPSYNFNPIGLFELRDSTSSPRIILYFIFLAFLVISMIRELLTFLELKKKYFKKFWTFNELIVISFSWSALAIYVLEVNLANGIFNKNVFSSTSSVPLKHAFLNRLSYINYFNDLFRMAIGFCLFSITLRILKLLRYFSEISVFMISLSKSFQKLFSFFIIFMVAYVAFVQCLYLLFYQYIPNFSTIISSMETLFKAVLGSFEVHSMIKANPVLAPLFFGLYNILIVFIMVSTIITIITDVFAEVKNNHNLDDSDREFEDFFIDKISQALFNNRLFRSKKEIQKYENKSFKRNFEELDINMDKLASHINSVSIFL